MSISGHRGGCARAVRGVVPAKGIMNGTHVGVHQNSVGQQNFFAKPMPSIPEELLSLSALDVDTRLHTLLYELQEELDACRKETARARTVSVQEDDKRRVAGVAVANALRENEELRVVIEGVQQESKAKEKEHKIQLRRVDTAARSEVQRRDKTIIEDLQQQLQDVKAKAAEREAKHKAETELLRTSLHEERARASRLEAALHDAQCSSGAKGNVGGVTRLTPGKGSQRGGGYPCGGGGVNGPHHAVSGIPQGPHHAVSGIPQVVERGRGRGAVLCASRETCPSTSPSAPAVVRYQNGDKKETDAHGVVRYWFAEKNTLMTTHPDGKKVVEFKDIGQREVHYPDGSRDVVTKDGEKVHFPKDSYHP